MSEQTCSQGNIKDVAETKLSLTRRNFLTGVALAAGAMGLTSISETAEAATKKYKVCSTKDIKLRGGAIFRVKVASGNIMVMITQPKSGIFRAFNPACTHEGFQISGLEGGNLVCQMHGAQFDPTSGAVKRGPAQLPLRRYTVTKSGSTLYINA
ncbi:MAG: Rieske (2Fe-2S) protein [Rhodoluna sp.]